MKAKRKAKTPLKSTFDILSIHQLSRLGMTFWVGGTLTIAAIIIPLLFKMLDEISAANITGQILNINAYVGAVAVLLALLDTIIRYQIAIFRLRQFWYIIVMLSVIIVNYFAIFPLIVQLRARLTDVANHVILHSSTFSFWHSVSSLLFVITCILGTLYIVEQD